MGVLEFFGTLIKNNITSSSIKSRFEEKMNINHFLLDFNSIIYGSKATVLSEVNGLMKMVLKFLYRKKSIQNEFFADHFKKHKMLDIQKKIQVNTDPMDVIKMFHSHFNDKLLDKMIITVTINKVFYLIRTYCDNAQLKTLMLALDGVPSKGKMVEQKQRRTLDGAISEEYKSRILHKYKDYLSEMEDYVYLTERYAIKWVSKMTPGTEFMHNLSRYLRSDMVQEKFKTNRPDLKIIISDVYEVGEGEKKIMNYIQKNLANTKDSVVVYSPDADVILLCMLVPVKNIYVLRQNQQEMAYDLINTKMLKENIKDYVNNNPEYPNGKFDMERVSYDIVFISTLFGDDFVPRLVSLNVKQGFQNILEAYIKALNKYKDKGFYLVKANDGVFDLSFTFLKYILKLLLPVEEDFIKNNSLYNKYINAAQIKYVFSYMEITESNIVATYTAFMHEYNELQHRIRQRKNLTYFESNDDFIESLKKSTNITVNDQPINTLYLSNAEFLNLIVDYYRNTQEFPRLNINLNSYSTRTTDQFHKKRLKQNGIENEYQKELYKFDKMLDEYYVKFNAGPLLLSQDKIVPYYQKYFNVKLFGEKNKMTKEATKVMEEYLEGLLWVFNFYYNDRTYINTWCYAHERSPLLTHFIAYLDSIEREEFQRIYQELPKYHVKKLSTYFTPLEQLCFVSPLVENTLKLLPKNYQEFITTNPFMKKYYINIKEVVNKLWNDKVSPDIDCKGIPYFNKCILKQLHRTTTEEDKEFLKEIRKVKPSKESILRSKNVCPVY